MYGAKASAIAKAVCDTWGVKPTEKQAPLLNDAIFKIADNNAVPLKSLTLPVALQHEEFRRLVISLAENPLAG